MEERVVELQSKEIYTKKGFATFKVSRAYDKSTIKGQYYPQAIIIKGTQTVYNEKGEAKDIANVVNGNSIYLDNLSPSERERVRYEDIVLYDGYVDIPLQKKTTIEYLETIEENVNILGSKRSKYNVNKYPFIERVDNAKYAEVKMSAFELEYEAVTFVKELKGDQLKTIAQVFGVDPEIEVIAKQALIDIAKKNPEFFLGRAKDDTAKQQAEINGLIEKGAIQFDESLNRYHFYQGNKKTLICPVPPNVDRLVFVSDYLFMPESREMLETIRKIKK